MVGVLIIIEKSFKRLSYKEYVEVFGEKRTKRIFDGKLNNFMEVVDATAFDVATWVSSSLEFQHFLLNDLIRD